MSWVWWGITVVPSTSLFFSLIFLGSLLCARLIWTPELETELSWPEWSIVAPNLKRDPLLCPLGQRTSCVYLTTPFYGAQQVRVHSSSRTPHMYFDWVKFYETIFSSLLCFYNFKACISLISLLKSVLKVVRLIVWLVTCNKYTICNS